jgi:hypothetical protein
MPHPGEVIEFPTGQGYGSRLPVVLRLAVRHLFFQATSRSAGLAIYDGRLALRAGASNPRDRPVHDLMGGPLARVPRLERWGGTR